MRTPEELQALLTSVIARAPVDEAQIRYEFEQRVATRFGENAITQNLGGTSEEVSIDVSIGRREGSARTNRLDPVALRAALDQAIAIARAAPENPEFVPLPPPQQYPDVPPGFDAATDALGPEDIARDVRAVIDAGPAGYRASGLFSVMTNADAIANTNGLFGRYQRTYVNYSATLHGPSGSGKAQASHFDRARIDTAGFVRTLVDNATGAQNPVDLEPGDYTVIFEPLATVEFLTYLMWNLSARDADEGSTAFAGRLGTPFLSDRVTLALRTDDPDLPASPYGSAGLVVHPTVWIEQGVVRHFHYDRFWASRVGVEPDAAMYPLFMDGEDRSVNDLVRSCKRGLLVKNLWYIRFVDRKALMLTGMTRDGLFLVQDGAVVGPVKNMRWNESPITFLQNVVGLSRPERVGEWGWAKLPGVMSEGFTFTSKTESV
jgi:predicted Zn-dependent protease